MSYFGNQPTQSTYLTNYFSGTGSQTAFTLSRAPISAQSILVFISGVKQHASTYGVSGTTLTFSAAPPTGTNNIEVMHLGIAPDTVTLPSYRTITEFTATSGQTTFATASYTVGYIDVYRNGVKLGSADFTATDGVNVVLSVGAGLGDLIRTESFLITSVTNAIQAVAGSVSSTYLAPGAAIANVGAGGVAQSNLAAGVAGNGPAFSAYMSTPISISNNVFTKVAFQSKEFDTANVFDNTTNYRFQPQIAGYYNITGAAAIAATGSYFTFCSVYKNGSAYKHGNVVKADASAYPRSTVSINVYMNGSTDYIELYSFQFSGSTQNFDASLASTYFQAALIRSA